MIALSACSGAPVICCWGDWLNDRNGRPVGGILRFDEPMEFPPSGKKKPMQQVGMQEWGRRCEQFLRRSPANWLFWLDKGWTKVWQNRLGQVSQSA